MPQVSADKESIAAFCRKWKIAELALFGSVLRSDFRPDSDVDVLVTFMPEARPSLLDLARMERELQGIFGREVDLVDRTAVERSRNYIRRSEILSTLEVIHAA
jgi:hypothetical protein